MTRSRFLRNDRGEASMIAAIVVFSLIATMIPTHYIMRNALRQEMDAHNEAARKSVEAAKAEADAARAAAEASKLRAELAAVEVAAAIQYADAMRALADAALAEAERAKAHAAHAQKGAFCATNPDHPECELANDDWFPGHSCERTAPTVVVCTKNL